MSDFESPARIPPATAIDARTAQLDALARLLDLAQGDTGQSRRAANFLLAWWNAPRDGGFDLTDLWYVDRTVTADMVAVFTLVADNWHHADIYGYGPAMHELVTRWRRPKRRRASR